MADKTGPCFEVEPGSRVNSYGQHITVLNRLQNPVHLKFIGLRPTTTYIGGVTGVEYYVGGKITEICVDERDVDSLLSMRYGHRVLFTRDRAKLPVMARAIPVDDDPDADPVTFDVEAESAKLQQVNGIGEATALKLAQAGITLELLLQADDSQAGDIAKVADISSGMATRAIEGAKEWRSLAESAEVAE